MSRPAKTFNEKIVRFALQINYCQHKKSLF